MRHFKNLTYQSKTLKENIKFSEPYCFTFFKGCFSQILLGPFLNTLSHIYLITWQAGDWLLDLSLDLLFKTAITNMHAPWMGLAQNAKINEHNFQFAVLLLPHALGRADSYPLNIYPLDTYPPRNLPPGHFLTWMVTPPPPPPWYLPPTITTTDTYSRTFFLYSFHFPFTLFFILWSDAMSAYISF